MKAIPINVAALAGKTVLLDIYGDGGVLVRVKPAT